MKRRMNQSSSRTSRNETQEKDEEIRVIEQLERDTRPCRSSVVGERAGEERKERPKGER